MKLAEFKASLSGETPPPGLSPPLQALWRDAKGHWDTAHKLAQSQNGKSGAWVHAYLHRAEGDEANAGYWYRRASRTPSTLSLPQEWEEIATALLAETCA